MNIIIILGNKLQKDGEMDKVLINRLDRGIKLFDKDKYIIVSGGKVQDCKHTESYQMKRYLENIIPSDKIITEARSKNTIENARMCLSIIQDLGNVKNITVISSKFHIRRVRKIFNHHFKRKITYIGSADGIKGKVLENRRNNEIKYYNLLDF